MAFFSTTSGVAVVDTRIRPGVITLPLTSQIPNRYLQIKDLYGSFGRSSLTISTQTGETFDDGTTSKILSDPYTFFTLYAASTTRWAVLGGTQTVQQTINSLNVSSITIGSGTGWLNLPPIQTIYASTTILQGQALYALSSYFGGVSSATTLAFWGLQGNYNNTVLAEVSTGTGTQEFLVFKGSSVSDRVRVQTTGNFVVETGVSARLWSDSTIPTLSNVIPAFIVNSSSNVGIQTATPGATLDVAGSIRGVSLSSQQLFVSSINGGQLLSFANVQSTVTGLGSAGYISSSQLISTVAGIGSGGGGGGITSNNLTSTVAGLGTAGYVSTSAQSQYSYFTVKSGTSYSGEPWTEQVMSLSNLGVYNTPLNLEVNDTVLRVTTSNPSVLRVNYMTGGNNDTLTVPRPTITMILSTTTSETVYPSVENFEGGGGSVSFLEQFDSNSRIYFKMRGLSNYTFGTIDTTLYRMSFELLGETRVINVLSNLSSISSIIDNLYTKNTRVTTELFVDLSTISRTVETNYLRVWDQAIIGSNSVTIQNDSVNASNVQVSSLNILDQSTMRYVPLSISSGSIYLNSVLASAGGGGGGGTVTGGSTISSLFVGSSSNQNFIKFWGSIGEYNNTAIVQQSTGGGTNEFLFFEGSSINDQFRFQTTGNIRFETGVVGPRNVNTATQLVTPTMMINSSSNVGIMTASPTFTLDVAGTARFQTLASTTSMYAGALYLGVFFG